MMIMIGYVVFSLALADNVQDDLRNDLGLFGWATSQIGGIVLAMGMLATGFMAKDISQNTRLGLILGATLVIGLFLMFPYCPRYYWDIIIFW